MSRAWNSKHDASRAPKTRMDGHMLTVGGDGGAGARALSELPGSEARRPLTVRVIHVVRSWCPDGFAWPGLLSMANGGPARVAWMS